MPSTWPWAQDEQGRRARGQSFLPSNLPAVADTPPPRQPFTTDSALAAPIPIHPSTYLPLPYQFPTLDSAYAAANDDQVSAEWRSTFPQFTQISAPRYEPTKAVRHAKRARAKARARARTRALNELQLEHRNRLEDEAYPLKLVRALASNRLARVDAGNPVFEVFHFNNTLDSDPIFRSISTYTTIEAANYRVMEFWDRTYGTAMFKDGPLTFDDDILFANLNFTFGPESAGNQIQTPRQPTSSWSGGVPGNNSQWSINNHCLSLSHKCILGERRVHTVAASALNNVVHCHFEEP